MSESKVLGLLITYCILIMAFKDQSFNVQEKSENWEFVNLGLYVGVLGTFCHFFSSNTTFQEQQGVKGARKSCLRTWRLLCGNEGVETILPRTAMSSL